MKTKVFNLFGLVAMAVIVLTSCGKDESELPYYDEIEDEKVIAELDYVPAYVFFSYMDCVFICYSEYVDEYFSHNDPFNGNMKSIDAFSVEVSEDIVNHLIGVNYSDFEKYGIPLNSKVYVSASVTNNRRVKTDNEVDLEWRGVASANKAYLKNITPRN